MTLLAALFERLDSAPLAVGQPQADDLAGTVEVGASAPAFEARQRPTLPTSEPAAAGAAEASSEPRRNAWTITRGGRPICTVCGAPMTRDEALSEARWRWADAEILES